MAEEKYQQETVSASQVAECINKREGQGWEYVELIEQIPAPTYADGHQSGPRRATLLFRRAIVIETVVKSLDPGSKTVRVFRNKEGDPGL